MKCVKSTIIFIFLIKQLLVNNLIPVILVYNEFLKRIIILNLYKIILMYNKKINETYNK